MFRKRATSIYCKSTESSARCRIPSIAFVVETIFLTPQKPILFQTSTIIKSILRANRGHEEEGWRIGSSNSADSVHAKAPEKSSDTCKQSVMFVWGGLRERESATHLQDFVLLRHCCFRQLGCRVVHCTMSEDRNRSQMISLRVALSALKFPIAA